MTEATAVQTIKTDATEAKTWLQKHQTIILSLIFTLAVCFLGNKYLDNRAASADQKVVAAQQLLQVQQDKNTQLAQQTQQALGQYQATVTALTAQNAQLASAISTRTVVLTQQQATDKTLPLPDLGQRWQTLTGGCTPSCITPTPDGGLTVTADEARVTVDALEEVPVLKANVADLTTQVDNANVEVTRADTAIGDLKDQVTGLQTQVTDQQKLAAAQVASEKAKAAKSKRNWFLRGLAVGGAVVTAVFLHF